MGKKIAAAVMVLGMTFGVGTGVAAADKPGVGNAVKGCTGGLSFGQANSAVVRGLVEHPYFPGYQAGGAKGLVAAVVAGDHPCG
ncbi:MAG TPA: hypothetical protein VMW08_18375 [Acidimicrobiales bacterium]|nr:hypothetical protein [Acidimicrobiales bacterium]